MLGRTKLLVKPFSFGNNTFLKRGKVLTKENVNPMIKQMFLMDTNDPVYLKSLQIKKMSKRSGCLEFDQILNANSGDQQASGYPPITFIRQVACAAIYPALINNSCFPEDVKSKAKEVLKHHMSLGSYTTSPGVEMFREKLARYFCSRDGGIPCDHSDLFLNGGVTEGLRTAIKMFLQCIENKPPGVLIPSPSYPFGIVEEFGFAPLYYYLEEENNWTPCIKRMESILQEAHKKCVPRLMIVINPGNPTGTVFKREQMEEIIKFAHKQGLVIIADEVYQTNVYKSFKFLSFKKVMHEMGPPYCHMELASLFALSKGIIGEPGIKAGSLEMLNFSSDIMEQVRKSISVNLCSSTVGQVMMYAFANHPVQGDPSFELWKEETESRKKNLECKAKYLVDALNEIEGFSCKSIEGSYFAYPRITVPNSAVCEGMKKCYHPSTFYALKLLEEKGVLVTPGDVFGKQSTPHIRISILPTSEKLQEIVQKISCFNTSFLQKYSTC